MRCKLNRREGTESSRRDLAVADENLFTHPVKTPMRGQVSKLVFIDSSVNTHHDTTKIQLPPQPFSATGNERIGVSLQSFSLRRGWYNINPTNNTFYLFANNVYYECAIEPGVYSTFAALTIAIQDAVTITGILIPNLANIVVAYNPITRKFTFTVTATVAVSIRCFAIKSGVLPPGVSLNGGFNDSYEILGAVPNRDAGNLVDSLSDPLGVLVSVYPASLNTLDAIYLHMNTVETGNWMSTGHESHAQDSLRVIESSIFARIPFNRSSFDEVHEVISYEDSGGDAFQSILTRKHVDTLDIRVTDARGRSLAQLDPEQADNGLMAYRMCLRWDLFIPPQRPVPRHAVPFDHPPIIA